MRYRNTFPIVYTADLSRSLAFYRDTLGFVETFRFPTDGQAQFVSLELSDKTGIALSGPGESLHGRPIEPGAGGFELCVYVDDVDQAVAEVAQRGHEVLRGPADQPWGERMAYVADPDGNPIMICATL